MPNQEMKSLNHCIYNTSYHLVLVTKYRKKVINTPILNRIKYLAQERTEAWKGSLHEINGEPDHIHLMLTLPPNVAISDFVNALKTGISRRIRNEFHEHVKKFLWGKAFWSRSYCVVSCGGAPLNIVKQYIQNQKGT